MASVNKVIIVGNLGRDPETRHASSGDAICNITVATTETWKDKNTGEKREAAEWHRVVFFGKLAEIAGQYLRKGSQVYLEGKLTTRKWQDKDGQDRYTTEILADELKMLGSRSDGGDASGSSTRQQAAPASQPRQSPPPAPKNAGSGGFDDDIPF